MEHQIVEENAILEIRTGSHLYGTSTPNSDEDQVGIFVAPLPYYYGLDKVEVVEMGIESKDDNGKNLPNALDRKYYEFRHFAKLAKSGNPSIVELLFSNQDNLLLQTEAGAELYRHKHLFIGQHARDKFLHYANSQKKQMVNKPENLAQVEAANAWLLKKSETMDWMAYCRQQAHEVLPAMVAAGVAVDRGLYIEVGKSSYSRKITMHRLQRLLAQRIAKVTDRRDLWTRYGYDTKYGAHLIRLLLEGIELMRTGNIVFPLQESPLLLKIRAGWYQKEEVLAMAEDLEAKLAVEPTSLRKVADHHGINQLMIRLAGEWHKTHISQNGRHHVSC